MKNIKIALLMLVSLGAFFLSSCNDDEPMVIEANFEYTENKGVYEFKVLNREFDSVLWLIEGKSFSDNTFKYTFENEGQHEVKLTVYVSDEDGDLVMDDIVKTISVYSYYDIAEIKTSYGDIYVYLYQSTPKHKDNFIKLTNDGFYDSTTFHRVINDFMIQGGDPNSKDDNPNNDGNGGPGYTIPAEINPNFKHNYGAVAAARLGNNVNPQKASSGSQFYIVENPNGAYHLDNEYTIFGFAFSGMDVVSKIAEVPVNSVNNRPINDVKMSINMLKLTAAELKDKYQFEIPSE